MLEMNKADNYKNNIRDIVISKSLVMANISYRSDIDALKEVEDLADEIIKFILNNQQEINAMVKKKKAPPKKKESKRKPVPYTATAKANLDAIEKELEQNRKEDEALYTLRDICWDSKKRHDLNDLLNNDPMNAETFRKNYG